MNPPLSPIIGCRIPLPAPSVKKHATATTTTNPQNKQTPHRGAPVGTAAHSAVGIREWPAAHSPCRPPVAPDKRKPTARLAKPPAPRAAARNACLPRPPCISIPLLSPPRFLPTGQQLSLAPEVKNCTKKSELLTLIGSIRDQRSRSEEEKGWR